MKTFLRLYNQVETQPEMLEDSLVKDCQLVEVNISGHSVELRDTLEREYGMISKEDFIGLVSEHNPAVVEIDSAQSLHPFAKICHDFGIALVSPKFNLDYDFDGYKQLTI